MFGTFEILFLYRYVSAFVSGWTCEKCKSVHISITENNFKNPKHGKLEKAFYLMINVCKVA